MGAERRSPSAAAVSAAADSPPVQSVAVDLRRAVRIVVISGASTLPQAADAR